MFETRIFEDKYICKGGIELKQVYLFPKLRGYVWQPKQCPGVWYAVGLDIIACPHAWANLRKTVELC